MQTNKSRALISLCSNGIHLNLNDAIYAYKPEEITVRRIRSSEMPMMFFLEISQAKGSGWFDPGQTNIKKMMESFEHLGCTILPDATEREVLKESTSTKRFKFPTEVRIVNGPVRDYTGDISLRCSGKDLVVKDETDGGLLARGEDVSFAIWRNRFPCTIVWTETATGLRVFLISEDDMYKACDELTLIGAKNKSFSECEEVLLKYPHPLQTAFYPKTGSSRETAYREKSSVDDIPIESVMTVRYKRPELLQLGLDLDNEVTLQLDCIEVYTTAHSEPQYTRCIFAAGRVFQITTKDRQNYYMLSGLLLEHGYANSDPIQPIPIPKWDNALIDLSELERDD